MEKSGIELLSEDTKIEDIVSVRLERSATGGRERPRAVLISGEHTYIAFKTAIRFIESRFLNWAAGSPHSTCQPPQQHQPDNRIR